MKAETPAIFGGKAAKFIMDTAFTATIDLHLEHIGESDLVDTKHVRSAGFINIPANFLAEERANGQNKHSRIKWTRRIISWMKQVTTSRSTSNNRRWCAASYVWRHNIAENGPRWKIGADRWWGNDAELNTDERNEILTERIRKMATRTIASTCAADSCIASRILRWSNIKQIRKHKSSTSIHRTGTCSGPRAATQTDAKVYFFLENVKFTSTWMIFLLLDIHIWVRSISR